MQIPSRLPRYSLEYLRRPAQHVLAARRLPTRAHSPWLSRRPRVQARDVQSPRALVPRAPFRVVGERQPAERER